MYYAVAMSGLSQAAARKLTADMQQVLLNNRGGAWTMPAPDLYKHQWFWDSAFIAIGLASFDPEQAVKELLSLRRGQWKNGMMPHIIFGDSPDYWEGPDFWRSKEINDSAVNYDTTAFTQPPVITIATKMVADKLPPGQAEDFLRQMYPSLLKYHQWMYRERLSKSGLIVIVHPWETGMDNSPPWMELTKRERKHFVTEEQQLALDGATELERGDTQVVPKEERQTDAETIETVALALQYRRWSYNSRTILERSTVVVESLDFNCILVQANKALQQIANKLGDKLPAELVAAFDQTGTAIEGLWSEEHGEYFSRNYRTGQLMAQSSVTTFMPLYAGTASTERKDVLLHKLADPATYGTKLLIPSAPMNSPYFTDIGYWRGPVWQNMNWFIHEGLEHYGEHQRAEQIRNDMYRVVAREGSREYYSTLTGTGHGAKSFGWTAALTLDWLQRYDSRTT